MLASHLDRTEKIMVPPKEAKVYDLPTTIMWFDDGILCSVAKKVAPQTVEEAKKTMVEFNRITGSKKVCLLSDSTDSLPIDKEMRDYAAEVMPQVAKAIAIMSRSALGKMSANLFFALNKQPYPVRFFND